MKRIILALMTVAIVSIYGIYAYQVNAAGNTESQVTQEEITKVELAETLVLEGDKEEEVKVAQWNLTMHNFGDIPQNIPAKAAFELTNNSDEPFFIETAKGSCGCTVADYNKEPILPGETTVIEATYNAKKVGQFNKTITVKLSGQNQVERLLVKGNVLESNS